MAKQVKMAKGKEFHFEERRKGGGSRFPWGQWFDGTLWMISKGEDFPGKAAYMPFKIARAARKLLKVVQLSSKDADGTKLVDAFIIKARPMTQDEVTAEKARRVSEAAETARKLAEEAQEAEVAAAELAGSPDHAEALADAKTARKLANKAAEKHAKLVAGQDIEDDDDDNGDEAE